MAEISDSQPKVRHYPAPPLSPFIRIHIQTMRLIQRHIPKCGQAQRGYAILVETGMEKPVFRKGGSRLSGMRAHVQSAISAIHSKIHRNALPLPVSVPYRFGTISPAQFLRHGIVCGCPPPFLGFRQRAPRFRRQLLHFFHGLTSLIVALSIYGWFNRSQETLPMSAKPLSARSAAINILCGVLGEGRMISDMAYMTGHLASEEKARALRLAKDTLRGLERLDRLLDRHLKKRPPPYVHNALRLGAFELCTGGSAHGVVGDVVGLVKANPKHGRLSGLVNAILRKMSGDAGKPWHDLRVPRLPPWLRKRLLDAWGVNVVANIEAAHFEGAPIDITVKSNPGKWAGILGGILLPTGSIRLRNAGSLSLLPGYGSGEWWVQDAASAIAARVLKPKSNETVLDMCAAPGGKTMQLANSGARVTALDISEGRMGILKENLERTRLEANPLVCDALEHDGGPYDAILLDAPCSATGTIRRHPDLPHARDGTGFQSLFDLQSKMMDRALGLLKPGGRLVYCTCSLLPQEGEVQVERALARHPRIHADTRGFDVDGVHEAWISSEGGMRLRPDYWPELGGMDGFYISSLCWKG